VTYSYTDVNHCLHSEPSDKRLPRAFWTARLYELVDRATWISFTPSPRNVESYYSQRFDVSFSASLLNALSQSTPLIIKNVIDSSCAVRNHSFVDGSAEAVLLKFEPKHCGFACLYDCKRIRSRSQYVFSVKLIEFVNIMAPVLTKWDRIR
jgi:hypothetical protein